MSDIDREIMRVLPDAATQSPYLSTPDIHRRLMSTVQNMPSSKTIHRHLSKLEEEGLVEVDQRGTPVDQGDRINTLYGARLRLGYDGGATLKPFV